MGIIRTHYLDASAIVKLLINEQSSDRVHKYYSQYSNFRTTSLCFAEALSVLKRKYLGREITLEQYLGACDLLLAYVHPESNGIEIEVIEIKERCAFQEVEALVKKYSIDVSDAFLIYTLKKGFFSVFEGESAPWLITGDSRLANAAKKEGLRVWDCIKDPPP
jgi:predicted nucleic acid-binding protein